MKIRNDFVTNSSSSSFIVVFKDEEAAKNSHTNMIERGLQKEFADVIYKDILNEKRSYEETIDELLEGVDVYCEFFAKYPGHSYNRFWETVEYRQLQQEASERILARFKEKVPESSYIAIIEYGDEDGSFYSALEHDIMPELDFVYARISHH
jgi:hypothetical protein